MSKFITLVSAKITEGETEKNRKKKLLPTFGICDLLNLEKNEVKEGKIPQPKKWKDEKTPSEEKCQQIIEVFSWNQK